jgi:hypothetical protein
MKVLSIRHPSGRREPLGKRKIKAKEFLTDIRDGMDDEFLKEKYGLSTRGVLQVMNRLIWQGLMSASELAQRRSVATTVFLPTFQCSSCGEIAYSVLEKCPHCGSTMKNLNEKKPDRGWY